MGFARTSERLAMTQRHGPAALGRAVSVCDSGDAPANRRREPAGVVFVPPPSGIQARVIQRQKSITSNLRCSYTDSLRSRSVSRPIAMIAATIPSIRLLPRFRSGLTGLIACSMKA